MAIAVFDYGQWQAMYPELATVSQPVASSYFALAGQYLSNTDCSPVSDVTQRGVLLNMITAHLVRLFVPVGGVAPSGSVGRVVEATEGSVSVKFAEIKGGTSDMAQFFQQTPYGFAFWAATSNLRRGRYVPRPDPNMQPYGNGWGFGPYSPG